MGKFIIVSERPASLNKGEYLIDKPSFLEEIALHRAKAPRNGLTGNYHLRVILDSIAQKYDPERMTAYSVRVNNYEGIKFSSDEELNEIIVRMLKSDYPAIFEKYLEYKIKNRPINTELIIYVDSGIRDYYHIFYQNGFTELMDQEPKKPKIDRVVGRPALTKEQAEALKKQKQEASLSQETSQ